MRWYATCVEKHVPFYQEDIKKSYIDLKIQHLRKIPVNKVRQLSQCCSLERERGLVLAAPLDLWLWMSLCNSELN